MWQVFAQLQKCSCPLQIVRSRDNSPADELDSHFMRCPDGLQFRNSRRLSRRSSDCNTNSELQTLLLITADQWPRRALSSTWWKSMCWSHGTSHNAKQNTELTGVKHGNQHAGIQMICFTWKINHIFSLAEAGQVPPEDNKQQLQDENTRRFWVHFWIKTFYTIRDLCCFFLKNFWWLFRTHKGTSSPLTFKSFCRGKWATEINESKLFQQKPFTVYIKPQL